MKKILTVLLSLCLFFASIVTVSAASGSITANTDSIWVPVGSSVWVTISANSAAGKITVSSDNTVLATVTSDAAGNSFWLDNDSCYVCVTGHINGSCNLVITMDDVSTYSEEVLTQSVIVPITVYTPTPTYDGQTGVESVSIKGLEVTKDSKNENTYVAYAPLNTTSIEPTVKPVSASAKVSEIKKEVVAGWNEIKFTVTAENGNSAEYTLKVYVEEIPVKTFTYGDQTLGQVVNVDNISLEGFEVVNGEFVKGNLKVLYLMNMSTGEKKFYVVDDDKVVTELEFTDIEIKDFVPTDNASKLVGKAKGFEDATVKIGSKDVKCLKYTNANMANLYVVSMIDNTGAEKLFIYDSATDSIISYFEAGTSGNNTFVITTAVLGGTTLIAAIYIFLKRSILFGAAAE